MASISKISSPSWVDDDDEIISFTPSPKPSQFELSVSIPSPCSSSTLSSPQFSPTSSPSPQSRSLSLSISSSPFPSPRLLPERSMGTMCKEITKMEIFIDPEKNEGNYIDLCGIKLMINDILDKQKTIDILNKEVVDGVEDKAAFITGLLIIILRCFTDMRCIECDYQRLKINEINYENKRFRCAIALNLILKYLKIISTLSHSYVAPPERTDKIMWNTISKWLLDHSFNYLILYSRLYSDIETSTAHGMNVLNSFRHLKVWSGELIYALPKVKTLLNFFKDGIFDKSIHLIIPLLYDATFEVLECAETIGTGYDQDGKILNTPFFKMVEEYNSYSEKLSGVTTNSGKQASNEMSVMIKYDKPPESHHSPGYYRSARYYYSVRELSGTQNDEVSVSISLSHKKPEETLPILAFTALTDLSCINNPSNHIGKITHPYYKACLIRKILGFIDNETKKPAIFKGRRSPKPKQEIKIVKPKNKNTSRFNALEEVIE